MLLNFLEKKILGQLDLSLEKFILDYKSHNLLSIMQMQYFSQQQSVTMRERKSFLYEKNRKNCAIIFYFMREKGSMTYIFLMEGRFIFIYISCEISRELCFQQNR